MDLHPLPLYFSHFLLGMHNLESLQMQFHGNNMSIEDIIYPYTLQWSLNISIEESQFNRSTGVKTVMQGTILIHPCNCWLMTNPIQVWGSKNVHLYETALQMI